MEKKFTVFALSDATGELAHNLAMAAVNQFPSHNSEIIRVPKITDKEHIKDFVIKAQDCLGVIVFTFVKAEMRREILEQAKKHQVVAIDILGPALDSLSNYFHTLPLDEPGLQYKQTRHYFKRTEAMEFTVKHDDGLGLETLDTADIIFLGVSRISKTPLSMYLAYQGYCCANICVIKDMPLPEQLNQIDKAKIIGLTTDAGKLSVIRSSRLLKLGRSDDEEYSNLEHVKSELEYAQSMFNKMQIKMINISGKAIEEVASEALNLVKK